MSDQESTFAKGRPEWRGNPVHGNPEFYSRERKQTNKQAKHQISYKKWERSMTGSSLLISDYNNP